MSGIWTAIERTSAVVSLVGVPYLVARNRKRVPRFRFQFASSGRQEFRQGDLDFGRVTFTGTLINMSLDANTIEKIHLVVWRTKRRKSARRYGYGGVTVALSDGQVVAPPIEFRPRESKAATIQCDFPLTGTQDLHLFRAMEPIRDHPNLLTARYTYELAFEDIDGNLFDQDGLPRSRQSLDLRWTIDNAWERFKDGHPLGLIRHSIAIVTEDLRFTLKRLLRAIGL